ncbi:MAG: GAF domain-containing sensor histidine kinase [Gemmobacter sp.]|uniref:GAF domain-containing sensor histidine kinase n=1 Tax=Gemmobacter sp. TaxID=1898957 RepID=UPI001A4A4CD7|nr:GAF domain-containing sensor histidine kinase [Gemmobacter sp.]MBL8561896.1 GAF domain-containing sensor histidine kinase [Gemmobacter sp.]
MTMMNPYPIPSNDPARSAIVDAMALTERRNDPFFGYVTQMVRQILGTPIAFISLFSGDRQTMLRIDGYELEGTPREQSLCSFTVAARETIVLPDTHADPRSVRHPIVTEVGVRFSASTPVITSRGFCLGTVCGIDLAPRSMPTPDQVAMLELLARMVARFYELPIEPDPDQAATLRKIADDAQREFLDLVGHEMRTPLNGIHGMAQLLEPQNEEEEEVVGAILSSSEHLSAVVSSILQFTELSSGDIGLMESRVDLDRLVDKVMGPFQRLARIQGKTLRRIGTASQITLTGDAAKLELALACLLTNCLNHGGREIVIDAARHEDGSAMIGVTDNGPGITPGFEARVWEAFGVGNTVRTRRADGIGLGLPLSRKIVELHGGELHLLRPENGMTALLRLPPWRVQG